MLVIYSLVAFLVGGAHGTNVATAYNLIRSMMESYNVSGHIVFKVCWTLGEKIEIARHSDAEIRYTENIDDLNSLQLMNNVWFAIDMECNDSYAFMENVRYTNAHSLYFYHKYASD